MIEKAIQNLQFSLKVLFNDRLEFVLSKYMVIPMVNSGLFVGILDSSFNQLRFFGFGADLLAFRALLFSLKIVLQMPWHKYVLRRELFMFLLVGPHKTEYFAAGFGNSPQFIESLNSQFFG